jgi:hypothetical protein
LRYTLHSFGLGVTMHSLFTQRISDPKVDKAREDELTFWSIADEASSLGQVSTLFLKI